MKMIQSTKFQDLTIIDQYFDLAHGYTSKAAKNFVMQ